MNEGDQDMGTADLHGSTIKIETGKGEKTTFELVRVGTVKEFETVKEALDNARDDAELRQVSLETAKAKSAGLTAKLDAAITTYHAAKDDVTELSAKVADANGRWNTQMETNARLTRELAEAETRVGTLAEDHAAALANLETANEKIVSTHEWGAAAVAREQALKDRLAAAQSEHEHTGNALAAEKTAHEATGRELGNARAELEDLLSVKASLEESTTALEVRDKELCELREERDGTVKRLVNERIESNSALIAFRDEVLAESDRSRTILDTIAEGL